MLTINVLGDPLSTPAGTRPGLGNALVFGAVVEEALFTILGKAVSGRLGPLGTAALVRVIGAAIFLPFAVAEAGVADFGAMGPGISFRSSTAPS